MPNCVGGEQDMSEDRGRLFGYEIQHIFVQEIASNPDAVEAKALLTSVGFDLELR